MRDRLSNLRKTAETEGYMTDSVAALFTQLEGLLRHDLDRDLDHNKDEIIQLLDEEISQRYYDDADGVMRALRTDPEVKTAIEVITSPNRYSNLLAPKKEEDK